MEEEELSPNRGEVNLSLKKVGFSEMTNLNMNDDESQSLNSSITESIITSIDETASAKSIKRVK